MSHIYLECKKLFKVPFELMNGLSQHDDCLINDFGLNPRAHPIELRHYIDNRLSLNQSWVKYDIINNVTIYWQKSDDQSPLKYWKGKIEVPNTKTRNILEFILHKRRVWDIDLIEFKELATVSSILMFH